MKLHEFLDEIQMLPEASEKTRVFAASGRVAEDVYLENRLLYYRIETHFIKKYFRRRITGCCFCIIFVVWGQKLMRFT